MSDGVVSELAGKLLESWGRSAFKEAASWWGARGDLKKLQDSMRMIEARVRDAENRSEEEGLDSIKEWLRRLKQVLCLSDDLLNEVFTVDRKKQLMRRNNKLFMQLRFFLSRSGPVYFRIKIAKEIKSIRRELDVIRKDMDVLKLSAKEEPPFLMNRRESRETASFVRVEEVIGRENDKSMVIDMLCDPKYDEERVTIIPIVGFGGLGKTTLTQLVFNDERVKSHFDLIKWAYVPEVDTPVEVMKKVYMSLTGQSYPDSSILAEFIKSGIQASIDNKKYLLVLDDVWDDHRDRWLDLLSLLKCGKLGSKIIVTTRSHVVAKVLGTIPEAYKLGFLKGDESLELFKRFAFKSGQEESNPNLSEIAKEIVVSCGNVPLAIRVLGSLLYSKNTEEEWCLFRDVELSKAKLTENSDIMPVLKLSYDNLPASLKQCFAFCSLFPRDHTFSKNELVNLWMAQGYVEPSNDGFILEEVGDQYFFELLWRNFFQDVEEDEILNNNIHCKMHELVYDLCRHVASEGNIVVNRSTVQCTKNILHASVNLTDKDSSSDMIQELPQSLVVAKRMRSLLFFKEKDPFYGFPITEMIVSKKMISGFQFLRVLYLKGMVIKKVTKSVGRLRHLCYLNLSDNRMEYLPDTITRLENLQTLCLNECERLMEFPRGFTKLVNLRHLGILGCSFTDMPLGFEKMTSLHQLDKFVVGKSSGIDSLPALNLRGDLTIEFGRWRREAIMEARRLNLKSNQKLTCLLLDLGFQQEEEVPNPKDVEELLDGVQLPISLRFLSVNHYGGMRFPLKMVDKLTKLVQVRIATCRNCQLLPAFSLLPHLKFLHLETLDSLEYIENDEISAASFFPALESLSMWDLPELKKWSRLQDDDVQSPDKSFFPCLTKLDMLGCPKMMLMPQAPKLESLEAYNIHAKMIKSLLTPDDPEARSSSSSSPSTFSSPISLKRLDIYSINELVSLSVISFSNLESLRIRQCEELNNLMFKYPNSIRDLYIGDCNSLRNVSDGLQHLSVLEKLQILDCEDLDSWDRTDVDNDVKEGNNSNMSNLSMRSSSVGWQGLKSLRSLELYNIWKLELLPIESVTTLESLNIKWLSSLTALPDNIDKLSQLRDITIIGCPNLLSLPQSLRSLTSLHELVVHACPHLERRCKQVDGEDWPLIQHIPHVTLQ